MFVESFRKGLEINIGCVHVAIEFTSRFCTHISGCNGNGFDAFFPAGAGDINSIFVKNHRIIIGKSDGSTGQFMGVFAQGDGLDGPIGLAFGSDGDLYVASALSDMVIQYNGSTGQFIDQFVNAGDGGLNNPTGILFGADGHLYVASAITNQVLLYDGQSGDFIDVFASGNMSVPIGIIFGPERNFYVASFQTDSVIKYDGISGDFLEVFATGGGLDGSHFMLFGPNIGDLNGDGSVTVTDLLILFSNWGPCNICNDCPADLDDNCLVDTNDLLMLFANWG